MVCNDADEMVGIFTSKDLMRRVVALELDPRECLLSKVMTANPFSARLNTTILETLHSMHNGKFLHVPVFDDDDDGKLVGLVDVLQATCAIVKQMGMLQFSRNESAPNAPPLWSRSFTRNDESTEGEDADEDDSQLQRSEGELSSSQGRRLSWSRDSREESVSENDPETVDPSSPENPESDHPPDVFVYKLADWNGTNHRFTSSAESLKELLKDVRNRLGDYTIRKLHYLDDDKAHVSLSLCWALRV